MIVNTPTLTKQAVIDALNAGNSYAVRCASNLPCLDFTGISVSGRTISASTSASAYYMWIGYKEGYGSESGTNMILDAAHITNRRVSIPGRDFTPADVGRVLNISFFEASHWVNTGAFHIVNVVGTSAVLDRVVQTVNGETNVWWELGGGRVLRSSSGTADSYTVTGRPETGDHMYVRLFCVLDNNRQVWTQPFFVR